MDEKKEKDQHLEIAAHSPPSDNASLTQESGEEKEDRAAMERRIVRRLDLRLLPTVILIYIMNYIDRNGITTARLKGLQEDLHISDVQYATVIAILFVSYCPAQIPSNMALNYVSRPSIYIGGCVILWGLTSALTGVTQGFAGILACRVFIGLPEAAFYPGAMYLLSRWYTRKELAFRSAILYVGLLLSNAFGTLIAAGILSGMEGKRGIRAWRWLFYIEGSITILVGILSIWLLPDYPNNTRWLSPHESRIAQARIAEDAAEADQDDAGDSLFLGFKLAIKDPIVLTFALGTLLQLLGLSFVNFFPTLTQTLGYSTTVTLLLSAPPWIFAALVCLASAWHADKTGERFFHIAGWWWVTILGYIIALSTMNTGARYFSLFLMTSGYAGFAITLTWVSNAIPRPPAKRAAAMGIVNGCGNLGNLISSYVWKASWGPGYHPAMIICLISLVLSSLLALAIRQVLVKKNKRLATEEENTLTEANKARVKEAARLEGITFEQAMEKRRGFRFLY